jgi:dihydroflavonol-4-reductase
VTSAHAAPGEGDVFLTGASGFVGSHVLDVLLARGYRVRALTRHEIDLPAGVTVVDGDLRSPAALLPALRGCRFVIHTAALYSFSPRDGAAIAEVNVRGTEGLLEAARVAGVQRAVVTSSSSALAPARHARPVSERSWAEPAADATTYHASKLRQERAALSALVDVVTVLPTAPIGPRDHRPTPTGRIILDLLRGRIPATLRGGMNVVAVEDVAAAHILALEHGRSRERYIAGGVNLSLTELWRRILRAAGRSEATFRLPYALAAAAARIDDLRTRLSGAEPVVPLEGVHMGRLERYSTSAKAIDELGYRPSSVGAAIDRAVRWYREQGYAS